MSKGSWFPHTALLAALISVAACGTTREADAPLPPVRNATAPISPEATAPTPRPVPEAPAPAPVRRAGPKARGAKPSAFLGKPVAGLESYFGAPALRRREGDNEFQRYDVGPCRVFAIVVPAGGTVAQLWTGPTVAGGAVPPFDLCASQAAAVGS